MLAVSVLIGRSCVISVANLFSFVTSSDLSSILHTTSDLFFFYSRGIVHHEYAPEGQTINKEYYLQVLRRLQEAVRRKRPDMWAAKNFQLHRDNAPAHSTHVIHLFLAKTSMSLVRQAP